MKRSDWFNLFVLAVAIIAAVYATYVRITIHGR